MTPRDYFEQRAAEVLESPEYQAAAEQDGDRVQRELRARRARELRGRAALAIGALKDPKVSARVEALIHECGAGVLALAVWHRAYGEGRELTREERRAVQLALMSTQLEKALSKVYELLGTAGAPYKVGRH